MSDLSKKLIDRAARTSRKREYKMRMIAVSAIAALRQLGYANTSMRDIAEMSDLSLGMLNYYFRDKTELIVFCVRIYKADFIEAVAGIADAADSLDEVIDILSKGLSVAITDNGATHKLWYDIRTQAMFNQDSALMLAASGAAAQEDRPNIVFVLLDDAGFSDLGSFGSEIETPNMDALAAEGIRFTNFHVPSTCEATRVTLHSGVDNHLAGAGTLQVAIAENQIGQPGYEGYLSDNVHSLGQLLSDGGYATYFSGKWNIGDGLERSPGARGWDRYIGLEQTGADNFEERVYAPLNLEAVWWEDGKRAVLPDDFYSTRFYFDKAIQFIAEGRDSGKPFFAMISLQAVHSPLQAFQEDIDKYMDVYAAGWDKIRDERYQRQVEMGLVPGGLTLPSSVMAKSWDELSESDQKLYAKKMAIYAGMLDSVDQNLGRFMEFLDQAGYADNTVFMIMSDNGADPYELNNVNPAFKIWYRLNYSQDYDTLGQKGTYVHYGQDWAEVSNTPFAGFKGTSRGGGMRVPFIVATPDPVSPGRIIDQFSYATDFLPTVLDIAGIPLPPESSDGQGKHRPTGVSLLPFINGTDGRIHDEDAVLGYESTGGFAIFKGDHKLTRNTPPYGDG